MSVPAFPAYSPDLNPIEQAITKLKAFLRKLVPRSPWSLTTALRDALQQFTPTECAMQGMVSGKRSSAAGSSSSRNIRRKIASPAGRTAGRPSYLGPG